MDKEIAVILKEYCIKNNIISINIRMFKKNDKGSEYHLTVNSLISG